MPRRDQQALRRRGAKVKTCTVTVCKKQLTAILARGGQLLFAVRELDAKLIRNPRKPMVHPNEQAYRVAMRSQIIEDSQIRHRNADDHQLRVLKDLGVALGTRAPSAMLLDESSSVRLLRLRNHHAKANALEEAIDKHRRGASVLDATDSVSETDKDDGKKRRNSEKEQKEQKDQKEQKEHKEQHPRQMSDRDLMHAATIMANLGRRCTRAAAKAALFPGDDTSDTMVEQQPKGKFKSKARAAPAAPKKTTTHCGVKRRRVAEAVVIAAATAATPPAPPAPNDVREHEALPVLIQPKRRRVMALVTAAVVAPAAPLMDPFLPLASIASLHGPGFFPNSEHLSHMIQEAAALATLSARPQQCPNDSSNGNNGSHLGIPELVFLNTAQTGAAPLTFSA